MNKDISADNGLRTRSRTLNRLWHNLYYYRYFYILFLPALIFYAIFSYRPMYGVILAFKDLKFSKGIWGSPWTTMYGFQHFYNLLSDMDFKIAFRNTVIISLQRLIFEFPVPIILSLLINEVRNNKRRRLVQTVLTFPHFLSWVVVSGVFFNLLADSGAVNQILTMLNLPKVHLLTEQATFRGLLYGTSNWKEAGWGTIIYLAAISGVNKELYEAAIVDGAKRFQLMRYITWPAMMSIIGVMFILAISNIMNAGFDQIFNMYNAAVFEKADIIDTFIYRRTFIQGLSFSSSTAIGLFKSAINVILLVIANSTVKKMTGSGIY